MNGFRACAAAIGASLVLATAARAAFIPEIDLRDSAHAIAYGESSYSLTWGGLGIHFDSLSIASGSLAADGSLYWSADDGLGIQSASYEEDEIEGGERLRIRFDEPVLLERLLISDLFVETVTETGSYSLDGGATWISFSADGLDSNGEVAVTVQAEITSLLFSAAGKDGGGNHDFAIAGFDANRIAGPTGIPQVPEPATGALMGASLLALALRARRRT
jgi:hypothetical protein